MRGWASATILLASCADEPAPDPGIAWEPQGPTAAHVIARFQACMDFNDFRVAGMYTWWNNVFTTRGYCSECHGSGFGESDFTQFDRMRWDLDTFFLFFGFHSAGDGAIVVNEVGLARAAASEDLGGGLTHPRFVAVDDAMQRLHEYRRMTQARIDTDTCPPPTGPDL